MVKPILPIEWKMYNLFPWFEKEPLWVAPYTSNADCDYSLEALIGVGMEYGGL